MKLHTRMMACITGTLLLAMSATAAGRPANDLGALVARIHKESSTAIQARYSREVHKSVNVAAVQDMEQSCAQKHPGMRVQTFSLVGIMRVDGTLKAPTPLPDNAFTSCVASTIDATHFPLPPGNVRGWPVSIQFDGTTGRALHMAGDKQAAMPMYASATMTSMQWAYTPMPLVPANLSKPCVVSIWVSIEGHARIESADVGDSSCPSKLNKAVADAARQWLTVGKDGSASHDSLDVRISFSIEKTRIRVTL